MKKILLVFVIIIILIIGVFNGYKYNLYNDGKEYLKEKYPNHEFSVSFVRYDFLYKRYNSKVYCKDMGIDFNLTYNGKNTYDNFTKSLNINRIKKFIYAKVERDEWMGFVSNISASATNYSVLENENIDLEEINYSIYVNYYYNVIQNNKQFAEISHEIINTLKQRGVKFSGIWFTQERDGGVFDIFLENEDIYMNEEDIFNGIRRRK